jgi:homopolymeric O-antigen transport system permease protein
MLEIYIEAGRTERQYWRDLWRYRELFYFLTWRDILVRYKQTVVGASWAVIRPLITMMVMTIVFGKLAEMPSGGAPYPILVLCGVLPWQFFSAAVSESGNSLVSNTSLISKVYFPRMAVPASTIGTSLVDFLISGIILVLLMIWYQFAPGPRMLLLPLIVGLALVAALGAGLWLSALTVRYRDFRHVIPFIAQLGLYLSPVGFTSDVVPEQWRVLYSLNPMVGVIDAFRWAILGPPTPLHVTGFLMSLVTCTVLLVTGIRYFRATERTFADII